MSYNAIVVRVHTREFPGADNLLLGQCGQYQVIVNKTTRDGELGVFFESDGQLSAEFASANDLIRRKNAEGKPCGGMFEQNRKVKSIKLRGSRSDGYWCPLSAFAFTGVDQSHFKEGMEFCEVNGIPICNKYVTAATLRERTKGNQQRRTIKMFPKHIETEHFKRAMATIPVGSLITITEKLHGTSQRYGHIREEVNVSNSRIFNWFLKMLRLPLTRESWTHVLGTKNVVLQDPGQQGFHGSEEFRYNAVRNLVLHKGEILYGEVVGYDSSGTPIMVPQDLTTLKASRVCEQFGKTMVYDYGLLPGTCKFFVYRITQMNSDGMSVELPWWSVVSRCRELGISHVPELLVTYSASDEDWISQLLPCVAANYTEQFDGSPLNSTLSRNTMREGIVIRVDNVYGTRWMKNKSFTFGVLEGYLKDNEDYVDTEEAS